jgi:hypothetical protein
VKEASAELGRIVAYDIAFAPLVNAVEGEEAEHEEDEEAKSLTRVLRAQLHSPAFNGALFPSALACVRRAQVLAM